MAALREHFRGRIVPPVVVKYRLRLRMAVHIGGGEDDLYRPSGMASRQFKLKRLRPDSKDRAGCRTYHLFGHAAEEHMRQAASTMGADHDHIRLQVLRSMHNGTGCLTFFSIFFPIDSLQGQTGEKGVPVRLNFFGRRGRNWHRYAQLVCICNRV